jgi:hypothetical protein
MASMLRCAVFGRATSWLVRRLRRCVSRSSGPLGAVGGSSCWSGPGFWLADVVASDGANAVVAGSFVVGR